MLGFISDAVAATDEAATAVRPCITLGIVAVDGQRWQQRDGGVAQRPQSRAFIILLEAKNSS